MRYMMLVYNREDEWEALTQEQRDQSMAAFGAFHQEMMARGNMEIAERLQDSQAATTVQVRQGKTLTTDGPYAETKEQLGGIYVFDCQDLDDALNIASRIPAAQSGYIEVRPIFEA
jgi:hypothetical protein